LAKDRLKQQIAAALEEPVDDRRDALRLVLSGIQPQVRAEPVRAANPTGRATGDRDDGVAVAESGESAATHGLAEVVDIYFGSGYMKAIRSPDVEVPSDRRRPTSAAPRPVERVAQLSPTDSIVDIKAPNFPAPEDSTADRILTEAIEATDSLVNMPALNLEALRANDALEAALDELAEDAEGAEGEVASSSDDTGTTSLRAILENVKDAIITVDLEGRVLRTNPAAQRVFSSVGDKMRGRYIGELIPKLDPGGPALEALAERVGDTVVDLAPELIQARRSNDKSFTAEITVSKALRGAAECFVLCLRDVTDRLRGEQALRDSEARYRALVENAPEAIVVLDVEENRFVDANQNAAELFKMNRDELLKVGPDAISPAEQSDGSPSFGSERGYIDRALHGGQPVFEWLHRDAEGKEIPCEVRFMRLPSSGKQLVRASIIDIAARKHGEVLAYGERRVLERVAASAPLELTLADVALVVQQIYPDTRVAVMLLDDTGGTIRLAASVGLPRLLKQALQALPVGLKAGGCGAAASLGRQIVVRDIEKEALWGQLQSPARESGIQACCSTPIVTAGDRIHGTLAVYFDTPRGPTTGELDLITRLTQLAGIAIRRAQDEAALRASEARFRALFDNVVDGVFQASPDGDLISANPALIHMLGYADFDELKREGKLTEHYATSQCRERLIAELQANGRVRNYEYRMKRKDGELIVVLENSRVVEDEQGSVAYYEGTITDITQRKAAERALFKEKERAQVTLESIGDAVATTDSEGRVEYLNPVAEELTGWERRQAQGRHIDEIIRLADDLAGEAIENPVLRSLREGRVVGLTDDVVLISRDGSRIAIQDSAAPIQDGSGEVVGAVMVFHDVSQERQLHRKLSYYASHDSLTGLINRREFEERLSTALGSVRRQEITSYALLYMDLDQFKVVNDTCGHTAGDLLLRQLGDLLQSRVRGSDVLARLGGDEFAVLLSDCAMTEAVQVADALREAVSDFRFSWQDSSMRVGASIGIVPVEAESRDVGALLSAADVACYVAKDLGRNRIHVYQEGDAAERHQEMQWVARINKAREEERFELYFQPIVPIGGSSGALYQAPAQYELLLRMRDEGGKVIAPNSFIPAAERYNLMPSLDRWVVTQVLDSLVYRGDEGVDPYTLAVNLSGTTLNDARFLDFMLQQLSAANLPPRALCFEITETAAITNLANVVHFMNALKAQGCQFALDDFGSGLSSLTYLKNLPVDYVKIDGQFIRNVAQDSADKSMVEAIARMARALNIETIAERVESGEVLTRLGEIGVSFAQGFFIAVPRSVRELPVNTGRSVASA